MYKFYIINMKMKCLTQLTLYICFCLAFIRDCVEKNCIVFLIMSCVFLTGMFPTYVQDI